MQKSRKPSLAIGILSLAPCSGEVAERRPHLALVRSPRLSDVVGIEDAEVSGEHVPLKLPPVPPVQGVPKDFATRRFGWQIRKQHDLLILSVSENENIPTSKRMQGFYLNVY